MAARTGRVARTAQMDSSRADKMGPTVPAGGSQIRNRIKGRPSGLCPQAVVQRKGGSQIVMLTLGLPLVATAGQQG